MQTPSPCQLALDTKFGTGGVLTLEPKPEDSKEYDTVSVDPKGNVYVSGGGAKAKLVTPTGQASAACDESGRLYVDRTTGDTYLRDKRVKVAGGKCDPAEAKETWEGWLRAWGAAGGKLVGAADVNELFGVGYSWPEGLFVTKGVTWATFSQQGEKDNKADAAEAPHFGLVARITGLD